MWGISLLRSDIRPRIPLSGICSFRSHIPPRLRRGDARHKIENSARVKSALYEGFAHYVRTSPRKCTSLSGISSLCSDKSVRESLSPGFAHYVRTSLPACGGAMQNTKKRNGARVNSAPVSFLCFAEREGFEPSIRFWRTHAFQACLFSHSSISPWECKCSVFLGNNGI